MGTKSKRTIYVVIIFLLLLSNGIGAYYLLRGQKENEDLLIEKNDLQNDYMKLQEDLSSQKYELLQLKGQNEQMDSVISIRESEIEEKQAAIEKLLQSNNFTTSELNKAKELIKQLEVEKFSFQSQIDSLTEVAEQLKIENLMLVDSLSTERAYSGQLETEKDFLSGKVELGSLLQADELYAVGIRIKDNGAEKETSKIKKCNKIMVCYQTGENKVLDAGNVAMYLRLLSPNKTVLYVEDFGSGSFQSKESGEEIQYTRKAEFDYQGENKRICIDWAHHITDPGTYTAQVYQDGYLLGETLFTLD